jgi:hypothetical protein
MIPEKPLHKYAAPHTSMGKSYLRFMVHMPMISLLVFWDVMLYGVIGGYSKDRDIYSSKTLVTA